MQSLGTSETLPEGQSPHLTGKEARLSELQVYCVGAKNKADQNQFSSWLSLPGSPGEGQGAPGGSTWTGSVWAHLLVPSNLFQLRAASLAGSARACRMSAIIFIHQ